MRKVPNANKGRVWSQMPSAAVTPPMPPSSAPTTNPLRRPTFAIQADAGNVETAVPRNMDAIGAVANSGLVAIWLPAKPPTVMTRGIAYDLS